MYGIQLRIEIGLLISIYFDSKEYLPSPEQNAQLLRIEKYIRTAIALFYSFFLIEP